MKNFHLNKKKLDASTLFYYLSVCLILMQVLTLIMILIKIPTVFVTISLIMMLIVNLLLIVILGLVLAPKLRSMVKRFIRPRNIR